MSAVVIHVDREALARSARSVRWWPAALALVIVGIIYALVSQELEVGPRGLLLGVAVLAVAGARVMRWRGMVHISRYVVIAGLAVMTVTISISAWYLVNALLQRTIESGLLLRDGALLWVGNILLFALWYWEVDGGGPAHRHASKCGSTDFAFPQRVLGDESLADWLPEFLDYAFLAFNTSTAFSPTDTMVLARRAKVLMMLQSILSLTTIAVIAARAINTI